MPSHIILVDDPEDWRWPDSTARVVRAADYIDAPERFPEPRLRVINLCHDLGYLSAGYYGSLLAEARGDRPVPSVDTMLELERKTLYRDQLEALDAALGKAMKGIARCSVDIILFFGAAEDERFADLGERAFERFPCPILRLSGRREEGVWRIDAVRMLGLADVAPEQEAIFLSRLAAYVGRRWRQPRGPQPARWTLAILHDPDDPMPPSKPRTLQRFRRMGEQMGVAVELITRKDFGRLAEFDALFIRETTAIQHHTFRFAKAAEALGMPVIDDAASIMRCTNKVYLAELLREHEVPTPRTVLLARPEIEEAVVALGWPVVLKVPDGAFSLGVAKAEGPEEFGAIAGRMLKESEIVIAQEFMPTELDWRIGVLDGEPLFACKYFMRSGHWQILKHEENGTFSEGAAAAVPVGEAPPEVVELAVRASRLIGAGLYGVDIKQTDRGAFVIEVNDNPNIDAGCEDAVLKDELYRRILAEFVRRLEARRAVAA